MSGRGSLLTNAASNALFFWLVHNYNTYTTIITTIILVGMADNVEFAVIWIIILSASEHIGIEDIV